MLPMVVLAGGRGTRLGALTKGYPKSLVLIGERPFAHIQLDHFRLWGITEVMYLTGYHGDRMQRAMMIWNGKTQHIRCIQDSGKRNGTGKALVSASDFLPDRFFLIYGDSYLTCPSEDLQRLKDSTTPVTMMIFENQQRWGRSNVLYEDAQIRRYDGDERHDPTLRFIDYGLSVWSKEVLEAWRDKPAPFGLGRIYQQLIADHMLGAMEVTNRFYEIGSPEGLAEFTEFMKPAPSSLQNQSENALPATQPRA